MRNDDWMSNYGYFNSSGPLPGPWYSDLRSRRIESQRISVNKSTHRIRYENETESSVTLVIEPKEQD